MQPQPPPSADLVVGRVGRAQGVRGEVTVELRTDDPDARFAVGAVLRADPTERGPLTVVAVRPRPGGLVVAFDGVTDREGADRLRGTLLVVSVAELPPLTDPDEFYDHELVGMAVLDTAGGPVGEVADVLHGPGGDLLVVRPAAAGSGGTRREHLVPFVRQMVPTVDLATRRLVVDPPPGLLDPGEEA